MRVVVGERQGFAYAGSLDEDVIAEVIDEARDNAAFATPDEYLGLAEPDGVPVPDLDLFRPSLAQFPTGKKVDLALELERAVQAADPRITGVESAEFVDAMGEGCVVTNTGIRTSSRSTACYVATYCLATEGDETQTGFGFSVGREPSDLDLSVAAADAARRATRLLGATKPPSARVTVVLDPYVTAQLLGILGGTLSGEAVQKGRSLFADRLGEDVASPLVTLDRRPHQPVGLHRVGHRRRGARLTAQLAHRGRRAPAVRAQRLHGPQGRHPLHRQRGASRVRLHPGRGLPGAQPGARVARPGRDPAPGGRRRADLVGGRPALGGQPRERRLLDRRRGAAHLRRRRSASHCGSSRSPRPSSGC